MKITPRKGWSYVGCVECGMVTTVPTERIAREGGLPYCVHNDTTITCWHPRPLGDLGDWRQMTLVNVEVVAEPGVRVELIDLAPINAQIDAVTAAIAAEPSEVTAENLRWKRVALRADLDSAHIHNCLLDGVRYSPEAPQEAQDG